MNQQIQTRVSRQMAAAFAVLAERQRITPSDLLRQLIVTVLNSKGVPVAAKDDWPDLDARLQTLVSEDLKNQWTRLAERLGMGASTMLRSVVAALLDGNPVGAEELQAIADAAPPPEQDIRVRIAFRPGEIEVIDEQSGTLGWKRNTWIANVVRSAALGGVYPTETELAALHRSNTELRAVGRNLNQLVRSMNRDSRYETVTTEEIKKLATTIETHISQTAALLEAVENRWRPESFRPETPKP